MRTHQLSPLLGLCATVAMVSCSRPDARTGNAQPAESAASASLTSAPQPPGSPRAGYYRHPAIHGDTILFTSEGDLWEVATSGGAARRLTTGSDTELSRQSRPTVGPSPSRRPTRARRTSTPCRSEGGFLAGGPGAARAWVPTPSETRWRDGCPDGRLLVRTWRYSTLPDSQLVALDDHGNHQILPLAQASEGAFTPDGRTLFFTRLPRQDSQTKRYQGGTAESLWRYDTGTDAEAVALTADWSGTSHNPMVWNGRVYFLSDRDGVMNVYSMGPDGHDLKEETHHRGMNVQSASLSEGRIVYQLGADLWLLDLAKGSDAIVPITVVSDFDQLRDHWVKHPIEYVTSAHVAPDGSAAVFTARGEVFTLPRKDGRIVKVAGDSGVRYREAKYTPDGKNVFALSTETGETEFWSYPANGMGKGQAWTQDAKVLRSDGVVSPDGHWLAHCDKDERLWIGDLRTRKDRLIAQSMTGGFGGLTWSPDSQWLAYVESAPNTFDQLKLASAGTGEIHLVTTDRYNSWSPAWSSDGEWLYFLSDRMLRTMVPSPWGTRQPDPSFDRTVKIYALALLPDLRSPFAKPDELHTDDSKDGKHGKDAAEAKDAKRDAREGKDSKAGPSDKKVPRIDVDFDNLASRLREVPVPPGTTRRCRPPTSVSAGSTRSRRGRARRRSAASTSTASGTTRPTSRRRARARIACSAT